MSSEQPGSSLTVSLRRAHERTKTVACLNGRVRKLRVWCGKKECCTSRGTEGSLSRGTIAMFEAYTRRIS